MLSIVNLFGVRDMAAIRLKRPVLFPPGRRRSPVCGVVGDFCVKPAGAIAHLREKRRRQRNCTINLGLDQLKDWGYCSPRPKTHQNYRGRLNLEGVRFEVRCSGNYSIWLNGELSPDKLADVCVRFERLQDCYIPHTLKAHSIPARLLGVCHGLLVKSRTK